MKVYKFGGASVKSADGVRNLRHIVDGEENLFIIVSAMGKTTNALEEVFTCMQKGDKQEGLDRIKRIVEYHDSIITDLWGAPTRIEQVDLLFGQLRNILVDTTYRTSDAELWYDTIVAFGELISTTIVSEYLKHTGIDNRWIDMRTTFVTNQRHKDAYVDIKASEPRLKEALENTGVSVFVGQGFIGAAPDGTTTTLGREGSDYSAAVVANILDAESMSVWKDVDGVLNADPKIDGILVQSPPPKQIDEEKVIACAGRGVPVIQANLDEGLPDFPDLSYDFVILSRTLQAVKRPDLLLDEMFRVGRTGIVSFINFGHCSARLQLLFGDMPETKTLPWKWFDTPNIHLATIADFRRLCREKEIRILHEIPLSTQSDPLAWLANIWPNMFASTCVFILEK